MKKVAFVTALTFAIGVPLLIGIAAAQVASVPAAPGISPIGAPVLVDVGTLGSEVLKWVLSATIPVIGVAVTGWISRAFQQAGVNMSDAARARLQEMVVNGLNAGAAVAVQHVSETSPVAIKNAAAGHALQYVLAHGADTLKALGLNPDDEKTKQAIQARIETAIIDPSQPTAAILGSKPTNGVPPALFP